MEIILASASPRRRELLEQAGVRFTVQPAAGEEKITARDPAEAVKELAEQKAAEIFAAHREKDILVIGADTVVSCENKILGKPSDEEDAFCMLSMLQGNRHEVYTGAALLLFENGKNRRTVFAEKTEVFLYAMSEREIWDYIKTGEPADKTGSPVRNTDKPHYYWEGKAGGYGIQDPFGMRYIKEIVGDYYNVVGLPVARIYHELLKLGIDILRIS